MWYFEAQEDASTDTVSLTSTIRDFETDEELEDEDDLIADNSVASPKLRALSSSLPRLHIRDEDTSPLLDDDATDGSFSSYFGTLPRATRKLFKSELYLYKSESQLNKEKARLLLPDNWRDDEVFDPGQFGLLDNPGVIRMDFDDYPDSVWGDMEEFDDTTAGDNDNGEQNNETSSESSQSLRVSTQFRKLYFILLPFISRHRIITSFTLKVGLREILRDIRRL